MKRAADPLNRIRSRIDRVDREIVRLLDARAREVRRLGAVKRGSGRPLYSEEREAEVIRRLELHRDGRFPYEAMRNIFHEIFAASLAVQRSVPGAPRESVRGHWRSGAAEYVTSLPEYEPGQRRGWHGKREPLSLAANESSYGMSPPVLRAVQRELRRLHRYPDRWAGEATRAVARRVGCSPKEVVLGNGSDEIIDLLSRTFLRPGREALVPAPSFAYYELAARACGARPVAFPLPNCNYSVREILKRVNDRTGLVAIANPNSPTGTYLGERELSELLRGLPQRLVVLLDEAYWGYPTARDFPNGMDWRGRHEPLVVMRTLSKLFGLAGLRCAYAVCPAGLADTLNRLRQPFNVNRLAQAALVAAMRDRRWVARVEGANRREMAYVTTGLRRLGLPYVNSQANFVLVLPPPSGAGLVRGLEREGIWVRDTASFGLPGGFRVTIGVRGENRAFLDALRRLLRA
ncbi:MAG: histidinol-phosphate transaminase [Nitrospirae bacterium]|nr:histidinol-phosphate transaminase [Nitrospirota bacterium]